MYIVNWSDIRKRISELTEMLFQSWNLGKFSPN